MLFSPALRKKLVSSFVRANGMVFSHAEAASQCCRTSADDDDGESC